MNKDKEDLLIALLEEWFQYTNEKYAGKIQDRRWHKNKVGEYIKDKLERMNKWKNGWSKKSKGNYWKNGLKKANIELEKKKLRLD